MTRYPQCCYCPTLIAYHDDQEKSDRLAALVIESAVNQDSAKYTLGQIYDVISKSGSAALLVRIVDFIIGSVYISF